MPILCFFLSQQAHSYFSLHIIVVKFYVLLQRAQSITDKKGESHAVGDVINTALSILVAD